MTAALAIAPARDLRSRIDRLNWPGIAADLDASGVAPIKGLLDPDACSRLIAGYEDDGRYRSKVVMARHGFGKGEYKYFSYPLPTVVEALRQAAYPHLAPIANRWMERLGDPDRFPPALDEQLSACHAAGQDRPTPLLLRYGPGDFNCLHQDLYGAHVFPLQLAILLSEPDEDFTGGEFVVVEQRPRQQSRPEVVPLRRGDAVLFAVNHRPVAGTRGTYRVALRHGVSRIRSGSRHTLGIIFHDAR